ncbi:MAG: D-alanyl-D-alanine carboxypeptidase [Desulfovibrio sp.]|jgi:D-alanyl-D-alanine carboxypeptidase (penicillin-binding protein 5/6)|nr:D-alanyl-D-alanine carboxypeptidase [Desulfovibrio sp.]
MDMLSAIVFGRKAARFAGILLLCCTLSPFSGAAAVQKTAPKAARQSALSVAAKSPAAEKSAATSQGKKQTPAVQKNAVQEKKQTATAQKNATVRKNVKGKKNAGTQAKAGNKTGKAVPVPVKAYITMDLTHKAIMGSYNADRPVAPASLTKVLTMFVILDQVKARKLSLDSMVQVSRKAAGTGGSSTNLHAGSRVSLRNLLRGMAVVSGNDAAVAAAQHVAGSEEAFVRLMNRKAKALGMKRSVFKNVHGLPAKGQQSTARDLMLMTGSYLAAHPQALQQFHSRPYLDFQICRPNTHPLLGKIEGVDGLKTGYVGSSGYNLITTARRRNTRLVSVVLGAPSKEVRMQEAGRLLREAYDKVDAVEAKKAAGSRKNAGRNIAAERAGAGSARAGL